MILFFQTQPTLPSDRVVSFTLINNVPLEFVCQRRIVSFQLPEISSKFCFLSILPMSFITVVLIKSSFEPLTTATISLHLPSFLKSGRLQSPMSPFTQCVSKVCSGACGAPPPPIRVAVPPS